MTAPTPSIRSPEPLNEIPSGKAGAVQFAHQGRLVRDVEQPATRKDAVGAVAGQEPGEILEEGPAHHVHVAELDLQMADRDRTASQGIAEAAEHRGLVAFGVDLQQEDLGDVIFREKPVETSQPDAVHGRSAPCRRSITAPCSEA